MPDFVTLHLQNIPAGKEAEAQRHFTEVHVPKVRQLRGFTEVQRFTCTPHQLMDIRQPWSFATFYNFTLDDPEIDIPALAPLLADMREAGLIADDTAERIHSYQMYAPWKYSDNYKPGPLTHIMFLLANLVPGHAEEYHRWYDEVHSVEVSESPGYVGMRRGGLTDVQVPPRSYCPGDQLILGGMQMPKEDLKANLAEFFARGSGTSDSGIEWIRSSAASIARTVHIFESVDGPFTA